VFLPNGRSQLTEHTVGADDLQETAGDILKAFGTSVAQLTVIVTVIIASLKFGKYVDTSAWIVTAIVTFSLAYPLRRYFPRTAPTALLVGFVLLCAEAVLVWAGAFAGHIASAGAIGTWAEQHPVLSSVLLSFLTTSVVALVVTAHKFQEETDGLVYPRTLERTIRDELLRWPFYKRAAVYRIEFKRLNEGALDALVTMRYEVFNRTRRDQSWEISYSSGGRPFHVDTLSVDHEMVELLQRDRRDDGFSKTVKIAGRESCEIECVVSQTFRLEDSELYTSYTPTTGLTIDAIDSTNRVRFEPEPLCVDSSARIERHGNSSLHVNITPGTLPYQGIRLSWTEETSDDDT
jgi:hypothetical protein